MNNESTTTQENTNRCKMDNSLIYLKCLNSICDWMGREDKLIEGGLQENYLGQYCPKCFGEYFDEITEEEYNEARA